MLFTNHRVRALADAVRNATPLPDADPPLTELEKQGKVVFTRGCSQCHEGPGASSGQTPVVPLPRYSTQCPCPVDTMSPARFVGTSCAPELGRYARTCQITGPGLGDTVCILNEAATLRQGVAEPRG